MHHKSSVQVALILPHAPHPKKTPKLLLPPPRSSSYTTTDKSGSMKAALTYWILVFLRYHRELIQCVRQAWILGKLLVCANRAPMPQHNTKADLYPKQRQTFTPK